MPDETRQNVRNTSSRCFRMEILKEKLFLLQPRSPVRYVEGQEPVNGCNEPRSCGREQRGQARAGKQAELEETRRKKSSSTPLLLNRLHFSSHPYFPLILEAHYLSGNLLAAKAV